MNVRQLIISVVFKGDTSKAEQFEKSLDRIKNKGNGLQGVFNQNNFVLSKFNNILGSFSLKSFLAAGGIATLGAAVFKFSRFVIDVTAEMEMLRISMEVLTGTAEEAARIIKEIRTIASKTPYTLSGMATAAKILLQYRIEGEEVIGVLKNLGDVAMGDSQKLRLLAIALGQVRAAGRLQGQELRQFVNAAFNPLTTLEQVTGVGVGVLRKLMEEGKLSSDAIFLAFRRATEEGGKFYKGMEKGSRTLIGKWSTFIDSMQELGRSIGGPLLPIIKFLLDVGIGLGRLIAPFMKIAIPLVMLLTPMGRFITLLTALAPVLSALLNGLSWVMEVFVEKIMDVMVGLKDALYNMFKWIIDPLMKIYDGLFNRTLFDKESAGPTESQKLADQKTIQNVINAASTINISGVDTNNASAVGEAVRSQFAIALRQATIGALT